MEENIRNDAMMAEESIKADNYKHQFGRIKRRISSIERELVSLKKMCEVED